MKHEDIRLSLEKMTDDYIARLRPLIQQMVTNGAMFGSVHLPVGNEVRQDLLRKIEKWPVFTDELYRKELPFTVEVEKEWASSMLTLQNITLPNGKKWIENFDEKSAYEGFKFGVEFTREYIIAKLKEILKDSPNYDTVTEHDS